MSYNTLLTRLSNPDYQKFLEQEGQLFGDLFDEDFFSIEDNIPPNAQIRNLYVDEHPLNMFIDTVTITSPLFNAALFEGWHIIGDRETYLTPDDVQEVANQLTQVSDAELRGLFEKKDDNKSAEKFAKFFGYRNVEELLALQKQYFLRLLQFYQQAARAGDAVQVRFN
jgi:hypothetical protein